MYELKNFETFLKSKIIGYGKIKFIRYGLNWTAISDQPMLLEVGNTIKESSESVCSREEFESI